MLKAALEKIQEMSRNQVHKIGDEYYSELHLNRIAPHVNKPQAITVSTLEGIVSLVQAEIKKSTALPLFVYAARHNLVEVFTTYRDDDYSRDSLYVSKADTASPEIGQWISKDAAIIQLRSLYEPDGDVNYILDVLSKITEESKVSSNDNGLSQNIEAQKGIALRENITLKPRVKLTPYRTFLEIEQPESEFILRADEGARILIEEADGGVWKLEAKRRIKQYFAEHLKKEITEGRVIVTI